MELPYDQESSIQSINSPVDLVMDTMLVFPRLYSEYAVYPRGSGNQGRLITQITEGFGLTQRLTIQITRQITISTVMKTSALLD